MLRWCAYCQSFLGESDPFDDFTNTHGICEKCKRSRPYAQPEAFKSVSQLNAAQRSLAAAGKRGDILSARAAIEKAIALGFRPVDVLMGLLQPCLHEIGRKWERGEITVADEHRFTSLALSLVHHFTANGESERLRQPKRPRVLLVAAEGNFHSLGLQLVESYLLISQIPTYCVFPGLPASEVGELCRSLEPRVVGFSVSMPQQLASVYEAARRIRELDKGHHAKIAVGGYLIRNRTAELKEGYFACGSPVQLLDLLASKS